jgi:hypothetical protein
MLDDRAPDRSRVRIASEYVECGGRSNLMACITPSKFAGRSMLRPYNTTARASFLAPASCRSF